MINNTAYLDSFYFLAVLSDKPSEKTIGSNLKNRVSALGLTVVTPQVVIGEVFGALIKKYVSEPNVISVKIKNLLDEILYFSKGDCIPSFGFELMGHIKFLESKCNLDATDSLILAHAIEDKESKYFVTTGNDVLYNSKIREYEESLRTQNKRSVELIITDSL